MYKRLRWPAWIVLTILLVFGNSGISQFKATSPKATSNIENIQSTECPGLNLEKRTTKTDTYTIAISTPIAENEQINQTIQNWIKEQEDQFSAKLKANKHKLDEENHAHLNIQVDTQKVSDNIYSLVLESNQSAGGPKQQIAMKTFTINMAESKFIPLTDVIHVDETALMDIRTNVKDQLAQNQDISSFIIGDLLEKALMDHGHWKWSITKNTWTLYFDQYEIADSEAGPIQVEIPLEKLSPYLKEDIANQLQIEVKQEEKEEVVTPERIVLDPNVKFVALTFDDGPNPNVTLRILETLKAYNAKATFFMLGSQAATYPSIAKSVAEAGHEIGNHTDHHLILSKLPEEQIKQEIINSGQKIKEATGQYPSTFRPPYGAFNEVVQKVARDNEIPMILWSVDSLDWKNRNAAAVNDIVLRNVFPGSIILMHDVHPTTADALPVFMASLASQGYQFITVSELLSLQQTEEAIGPYFGLMN